MSIIDRIRDRRADRHASARVTTELAPASARNAEVTWLCPTCGQRFTTGSTIPSYCTQCGAPIKPRDLTLVVG